MEAIKGYFADSRSPKFRVTVRGSWSSADFEAIIDTGFEGLIALPIPRAMGIGLTLTGEARSTLADGVDVFDLTADVVIELGEDSHLGSAILSRSGEVLIGIDFLRAFERSLVIHRDEVFLIKDADLDPALRSLV